MQIENNSGYALVIHNGEVKIAALDGVSDYEKFSLKTSEDFPIVFTEYDDGADFYYHGSDDGDEYYDAVHVIATENSPEYLPKPETIELPASNEIIASALEAVKPLVLAVINKELAAADLTYAILMVSRIECIYTDYLITNDVLAAQKRLIGRIFHISEGS